MIRKLINIIKRIFNCMFRRTVEVPIPNGTYKYWNDTSEIYIMVKNLEPNLPNAPTGIKAEIL